MIINWIKLQNVRSYTSAEIKFPKGTTLLSGDIGSGKSTVLLSIEFALFGIIKGELSGNTLLRKGSTKASVELCISLGKKEIIIKRSLKKGKSSISQDSCYIVVDNVKKEATPVELKSKIYELIGYSLSNLNQKNLIFRYTVYTPQEEMKRIVFEDKEERLNTLRKVFGIDKYKRIRENSAIYMRKLKEECRLIEGYISDIDEKKEQRKELARKEALLRDELKPLQARRSKSLENYKLSEDQYKETRKVFEEFQEFKRKSAEIDAGLSSIVKASEDNSAMINEFQSEIKEIESRIESARESTGHEVWLEQKAQLEEKIESTERMLASIKEKKSLIELKENHASGKINEHEIFITENEKKAGNLSRLEKDFNALETAKEEKELAVASHEKKNKELIMLERNISAISEKTSSSNEIIEKLSKIEDCPLCLQKVSHAHKSQITANEEKIIEELDSQLKRMKSQKVLLQAELGVLAKKINSFEEKINESKMLELKIKNIKEIQAAISGKKASLEKLKQELTQIHSENKELKIEAITEIEKELQDYKARLRMISEFESKAALMEEKRKNIALLEKKNNILRSEIVEINKRKIAMRADGIRFKGIEEALDAKEFLLNKTKEELKNIEISLAQKRTQIESISDEAVKLEGEISKKEDQKKKLSEKRYYMQWIDNSFINIIAAIEKNILVSLYNEFNSLFQEWFDVLIEDELITARLDAEFTPQLQQNSYDTELENLSGGEKTALALAYRLALNKVINDTTSDIKTTDLIILDEPTDGFSEHQLDKIRDVLEKLGMDQVIIVSHESKIESYVDNIIKITKNEHVSSVS